MPQSSLVVQAWREHLADRVPSHLVRFEHAASTDVTGTFAERAQSSSLVVIGASRDWFSRRTLGGSFATV